MLVQMQQRRGTAAEWASANTVLAAGEEGLDTTNRILKVGDGITPWNSLEGMYITAKSERLAYAENRTGVITYSTGAGAPIEATVITIKPTNRPAEITWGLNTGIAIGGEGIVSSVLYEITSGGAVIRGVCTPQKFHSNAIASAQGPTHEGRCTVEASTAWRTFLLYISHYSATGSGLVGYDPNGDTDYSKTYLQAEAI